MKRKLAVFLTAVVVALGLLLGTSAAQDPQTIEIDPGNPGDQAFNLSFDVDLPGTNQINLVFTENKTLKFGPGPLSFLFTCTGPTCAEGVRYSGSLRDASGNEIPGTSFSGVFDGDAATVTLDQLTEWSGMRFSGPFTPAPYGIVWFNTPTVDTDDQFTLTVNKSGEGFGTVTSVPSGIDCGNTCSADFDNGTSVTLTATPDEGFELTSWSGCDQTQADTCSVSMTTARTVTVTFAEGPAQGEPIVNLDGDTATGIQNLNVGGTLYNVAFLLTSADELYGSDPVFDFPDSRSAKAAKLAVNLALNTDNRATKVGPSSNQGAPDYGIGFSKTDGIDIHYANYVGEEIQAWVDADVDTRVPSDVAMYADFTLADPPPPPVTIGGTVTGLEDSGGSGLVLNLKDLELLTITENGDFTFSTLLTPGNFYNVTVRTNPTNSDGLRSQTCIVENGIGQVPNEPVTDIAVTCVEGTPQVTIGGTVTGLVGSGLVLQNNGRDDLPITEDGLFTFARTRTSGTFYNVTVATNPKNPSQTCSVENGFGQVPLEDVTDVAISCVEVPVGNVSKVAAEGDTLPDDTTVDKILLEGGVAINSLGEVAFHGETSSKSTVFTQEGLVARKGVTLPDGSTVDRIYDTGGVAINLLGEVAFHGREGSRFETVFTQSGQVAQEGVPLLDRSTTPEEISASGKVAINLFGQVAFHGAIEVEGGLFDETFRAVFTQDGLVAREAVALDDGNIIQEISDTSGVAINDFGQVAFHGEVVNPEPGGDRLSAVFTQDGLVVKEGDTLPDGNIVGEIRKNGGVAINLLGQVAFQGRVFDPVAGIDTVAAVFTQDGLVVKEGDTLPDGNKVEEISETGSVAINDLGLVAFHGRTGSKSTVFTQEGLVAKEGDNLTDGTTTLDEISDTGGVAINAFGEVAFHGRAGGINAVFMSGSESPSNSPGEAGLFTSITW